PLSGNSNPGPSRTLAQNRLKKKTPAQNWLEGVRRQARGGAFASNEREDSVCSDESETGDLAAIATPRGESEQAPAALKAWNSGMSLHFDGLLKLRMANKKKASKTPLRKKIGLKRKSYSDEKLEEALKAIKSNTISKKAASKKFGKSILKKVERSMRSGAGAEEEYVPNLWYFEELEFLRDQETQVPGISTMDVDPDEPVEEQEGNDELSGMSPHYSGPAQKRKKSNVQHMMEERNDLLREAVRKLGNREEVTTKDEAKHRYYEITSVDRDVLSAMHSFEEKDEVLLAEIDESDKYHVKFFTLKSMVDNLNQRVTMVLLFLKRVFPLEVEMAMDPLEDSEQEELEALDTLEDFEEVLPDPAEDMLLDPAVEVSDPGSELAAQTTPLVTRVGRAVKVPKRLDL
ncbi:hypothetical protein GE061_015386, partial [Apolygus lucorum]